MRSNVAALYVASYGPYPRMLSDWYDEARDARSYQGSDPVVAHPPCGPWGQLRHMCKEDTLWCGPHAVGVVRANGGVLEHPKGSRLWYYCGLPRPGKGYDQWGGYSVEVNQCAWGHRARKPTWLYIVGCPKELVERTMQYGGTPTRRVCSGPRMQHLPSMIAASVPVDFGQVKPSQHS